MSVLGASGGRSWLPSPATVPWVVAGVVLLLLGILSRNSGVAAIGLPFLLGVAVSLSRRPDGLPRAEIAAEDQAATGGRLQSRIECRPAPGATELGLRIGAPGHRSVECLVAAGPRTIEVEMSTVRTGRRGLFWLDQRAASADHLLVTPAEAGEPVALTVLPGTRRLPALPMPFRLQGLTGPHGSRRAGEGGDLHDVAPFRPGDRLRRIDWRVTARLNSGGPAGAQGALPVIRDLYVRRTFATAEATVMLVLDSRDEVGPRVASWGDATELREDEPTSLDLARFAAASVARYYLEAGDRVGLEDLGRLRRPFPPAGGRQHLQRLVQHLALTSPEGEPTARKRVPRLPSGSLIVVFSTLLDDVASSMARAWRHGGHRVVVVDTLPSLVLDDLNVRLDTAYRIVAMQRQDRIGDLGRAGVETVTWPSVTTGADPGVQLGLLARRRAGR